MITPLDILSLESWILLVSLLVLVRLYIHKRWQFLNNLNIPHEPPTIFGLGNMGAMLKDGTAFYKDDIRLKKKFGKIFGVYFGLIPRIVVYDPEILKEIYVKEFSSFAERERAFFSIGGKELHLSLGGAADEAWKRSRSTLSTTFSSAKLRQMFVLLENCTDKMIANLKKSATENNGKVVFEEFCNKVALDMMCASGLGVDARIQDEAESKMSIMAQKVIDTNFMISPLLFCAEMFPWMAAIFPKLNVSVFSSEVLNYFKRLTNSFIHQKKDVGDGNQRADFLRVMLESEITDDDVRKGAAKGLTRSEIVGNTMLFILAGYGNISTTMALCVYNITMNKDVQEKLLNELEQTIEKHGGITYDGINEMKYLDMCVKETQRLYDLVGKNSRLCTKDITIKGVHFPAGVQVDIPVYALQHDEEYWDEPWEYKPERFEDMSKIDPMYFQPFGAGPRNCIGLRYALIEMKLAVCKVLQHFILEACEETPEPPLEMITKAAILPKEKIIIRFVERST